jgi:hypothetical protein
MLSHPGQVMVATSEQIPQRAGSSVVAEMGSLLAGAMTCSLS